MPATHMQWTDEHNITYTVDFDAVEAESPEHAVAITEYPIEMGAKLIDFVRPEQVKLKLTTYITNAPTRTGLSHMDGRTFSDRLSMRVRQPILNTPPALQLPTSLAGVQLSREVTVQAIVRTWQPLEQRLQRADNVYGELKRAMYEAREFTVVSDLLGDFDRMLIKSLSTDRNAKSGNGIRLDIDLVQVRYAELYTRDVRHLLPKPKKKQSEKPKDLGVQGAKDVDPATKRSVIQQIRQPSASYTGVAT